MKTRVSQARKNEVNCNQQISSYYQLFIQIGPKWHPTRLGLAYWKTQSSYVSGLIHKAISWQVNILMDQYFHTKT